MCHIACADLERGVEGPDPLLKIAKLWGFVNNAGPDPPENHKATKPALGHNRHTSVSLAGQ